LCRYALAKSPLEKHLAVVIDARVNELTRQYTGAALLRLTAAAVKSKVGSCARLIQLDPELASALQVESSWTHSLKAPGYNPWKI
jgi:hypothetical protein